jgi:hypothetical protein
MGQNRGRYKYRQEQTTGFRLRSIQKIWRPAIISNQEIWTRTEEDPIERQIRRRKFRWLGHTLRKKSSNGSPKEEESQIGRKSRRLQFRP